MVTYSRFGGTDWDVYNNTLDGANESRIINNTYGDYYPRYNPDGSRITFYTFDDSSRHPDIFLVNANGSGQVHLTTTHDSSYASWSPDGTKIVFQTTRNGNSEIYVMEADGSNPIRLTTNSGADTLPVFSPDGTQIAFVSDRDGNNEIYVMNADGSGVTRLTNDPGNDNNPSWLSSTTPVSPHISIGDAKVTEGNSGSKNANFTLTLSPASTTPVTVSYSTADGTAKSGLDYMASLPTAITFTPGDTKKTISIPVKGDLLDEANETFIVNITADGAGVTDSQGIGTITDDDATPSLKIGDIALFEGFSGTTVAVFPVTLSAASSQTVSLQYATADGTATAGSDYVVKTGTLTIPAGQTSGTISVSIVGDQILESNEFFVVNLSAAINASLSDSQGRCSINNDDTKLALSIADASMIEGGTATFVISLERMATVPVTVNYKTSDVTANAGDDYVAVTGTATIPAGKTTTSITVATNGDSLVEGNELFLVNLSSPTNAILVDRQATGTIANDDLPEISISDVSLREGDSGQRNMVFSIVLSVPAPAPVAVSYATANGTALSGLDYAARSGSVSFATGETSASIAVPIVGDNIYEADETFVVNLSGAIGGAIATPRGVGTIVNDETLPKISISDASFAEGNTGARDVPFQVTLSKIGHENVTLQFATADGTATVAGKDYNVASGTLTIPAGKTVGTIRVKVVGDILVEGNETFLIRLSNATNATIDGSQAKGTITNDDSTTAASAHTN